VVRPVGKGDGGVRGEGERGKRLPSASQVGLDEEAGEEAGAPLVGEEVVGAVVRVSRGPTIIHWVFCQASAISGLRAWPKGMIWKPPRAAMGEVEMSTTAA
jgi:hypothetical protein